jgi:hypothetical protein
MEIIPGFFFGLFVVNCLISLLGTFVIDLFRVTFVLEIPEKNDWPFGK